jgi:peptide-methionine (S)-S-oxide reductase
MSKQLEVATFAGGCFWCTDAVFKRLKGVVSVVSGYTGGNRENPSYEQVSTGATGHAEAIQVRFDPKVISYEKLLDVFWATHDPTTLNQQGYDIGTQYRSAIFYHDEDQKTASFASKKKLEEKHVYESPIVTEISPLTGFYPAENEQQDFYDTNKQAPYCRVIIDPKIKKLFKSFTEDVKEEYK